MNVFIMYSTAGRVYEEKNWFALLVKIFILIRFLCLRSIQFILNASVFFLHSYHKITPCAVDSMKLVYKM